MCRQSSTDGEVGKQLWLWDMALDFGGGIANVVQADGPPWQRKETKPLCEAIVAILDHAITVHKNVL